MHLLYILGQLGETGPPQPLNTRVLTGLCTRESSKAKYSVQWSGTATSTIVAPDIYLIPLSIGEGRGLVLRYQLAAPFFYFRKI